MSLLLAIAVGWVSVSRASAAQPILGPRLALTAAGVRAAQGPVLASGDFGFERRWIGGETKFGVSFGGCKSFQMRVDDLVLVGAAASQFTSQAGAYASYVQVFESETMAERFFVRMRAPGVIPCYREQVSAVLPLEARITSIALLPVARVAPRVRAYRMRWTRPYAGGLEQNVTDHIFLGRGRTIVVLSTTTHASAKAARREIRLARAIASRMRA
jgi:hypothetical protein